jgi:nitroreductase
MPNDFAFSEHSFSEHSSSAIKDLEAQDSESKVLESKLLETEDPAYPLHPLLAQRRSLRAFAARPVGPAVLRSLLEAARRAPSSFNEQPWRFIVAAQQDKPEFQRVLGCLMEFNVRWAQHAPVLLLSVARLNLSSTREPNRHAVYDVGQAMAHLTFQANALGLIVCQMAGFEIEKARETFSIPPEYEPMTAAAIGYPGDPATLPEKLQRKLMTERERKSLEDFVFEKSWGQPALWPRKQR